MTNNDMSHVSIQPNITMKSKENIKNNQIKILKNKVYKIVEKIITVSPHTLPDY